MSKPTSERDDKGHGNDHPHPPEGGGGKDKPGPQDGGGGNKISLVFVVNGDDVPVKANLHAPLHTARDEALRESENTGRPFDEWQTRDAQGALLDPAQTIESFGFAEDTRLYLSLAVGVGG